MLVIGILLLFVCVGSFMDVIVLVIGDVKSLMGGILIMIFLNVVDGDIYVVV